MSRFRPDERERERPPTPNPAQPPQPQPAVMVPIPAEEFNRQRRRKFLRWSAAGAVVAVVILAFLYRSTMPAAALNHYIDAKKLYDAGKFSDALDAATQATRDSTQRLNALRLRAAIYRSLRQPKAAVEDMTRVIEIEPSGVQNYQFRAEEYLELDNAPAAARDYTKIIELANAADAYNGRGMCYLRLNQPQKAIEDFTSAIGRRPSVEYYLQRGLAWSSLGDAKKAITDFDEAARLRPGFSAVYRARSIEKQELGDKAGAERDRQTAIRIEQPEKPKLTQVELPKQ